MDSLASGIGYQVTLAVIEAIEHLNVELVLEFVSLSIEGFWSLTPQLLDLTEMVHSRFGF